jgi:hypothetical protein
MLRCGETQTFGEIQTLVPSAVVRWRVRRVFDSSPSKVSQHKAHLGGEAFESLRSTVEEFNQEAPAGLEASGGRLVNGRAGAGTSLSDSVSQRVGLLVTMSLTSFVISCGREL